MAITYKWTINALDAHISHEGKSNVVYTVHWGYSGSEGDHTVNTIGTFNAEFDKDNFTEYADLKESDVIGWLEVGMDVDSMKESIKNQIDVLKTPISKTYHSPFASVAETEEETEEESE
tara:strand:- start:1327 stop:1683 length:357 start_codon:yes stop_codon:yes gene_type:complete